MVKRTTMRLLAAAVAVACWAQAAPAGAAPAAPRWVAAVYVEAQRAVGMRWNPVPGSSGYKVLRSTTAGSGYAEIAAPAQPQHFDTAVEPGTTYYYVLQSVAGAEVSPNSDEKSVTIPGQKKKQLTAPTWAKVTPSETTEFGKTSFRVGLVWNRLPEAVAYNIYRSTTPGANYEMLSSVSESQYADTTVEVGKTYYYTLTALDGSFQETPRSAEEKVTIEKKKETGPKSKTKLAPKARVSKLVWAKTKGDENSAFDLWEPSDLEYSAGSGTVLVMSNNTYQVIVLNAATGALINKFGSQGNDPEQFLDPLGIGLDGDDNVLITDLQRGTLSLFSQGGKFIRQIVPKLPPDYLQKFPLGFKPMDVAADPKTGELFVSDGGSKQIVVLDDRGAFQRYLAVPGTPAAVNSPFYIRFDKDGNVVVSDMQLMRIVTLDKEEGTLVRAFGENKASVDGFVFIGGFDFDAAGNVLVVDRSSNTIRGFLPDGRYLFNMANEKGDGGAALYLPKTIAIDRKTDTLFVMEGLIDRTQAFKLGPDIPPPQGELGQTE